MNSNYDDIIHLPHHVSATRPRMAIIDRAAQFSPFAALTGHDAAIKETARVTEEKVELDEYTKDLLSNKLLFIVEQLHKESEITFTYFQADDKKQGGTYVTVNKTVKKIDQYERLVVMTDGLVIPMDDIISIEGQIFETMGFPI